MTRGSRNLIILGVTSALIALGTTGVSLAVYHKSGDIYLDRSRPGYLPDKEEIAEGEEVEVDDYTLEKSGPVTQEIIDEYVEELKKEVEALERYEKPFEAAALGDEKLGIGVK